MIHRKKLDIKNHLFRESLVTGFLGEVYADLKSRIQQSNLENTLKQVKALLGKIKLDELEEEFSDKAESLLEEIKGNLAN